MTEIEVIRNMSLRVNLTSNHTDSTLEIDLIFSQTKSNSRRLGVELVHASLWPQFMLLVILKDMNLFLNPDVEHWSMTSEYQMLS